MVNYKSGNLSFASRSISSVGVSLKYWSAAHILRPLSSVINPHSEELTIQPSELLSVKIPAEKSVTDSAGVPVS